MGNQTTARTGSWPPLPIEKRTAAYQLPGGEPGYDGNPPEFGIRKDHVYADGKREATESPENINHDRVKWLFNHGKIDLRQYQAAERLSNDWQLSKIEPHASSVLVGAGGSGDMHPNDAKRDAMKRHGAAQKALEEIRSWAIVDMVVQQNMTIEKASARLRVHYRFGAGALNVALHFLANHYKLA